MVPGSAFPPPRDDTLQSPLNFRDVIALDHVAGAHVLVVLEGHAALLAGRDLAGIVLEALELRQATLVDDDVVADETHVRPALDDAVEDAAAGDLPDLRHVEDLEYLRLPEALLAKSGGEKARHGLLHVIHEVVDDVVIADFNAKPLGRLTRFFVRAHVEADHDRAGGLRQGDVGFGDAADARMKHPRRDLLGPKLLEGANDGFDRPLHVALDDKRELLPAGTLLEVPHHLGQRTAAGARAGCLTITLLPRAVLGDFACAGLVLDDGDAVARLRGAVEAEHLDGDGGARLLHVVTLVVDQRPDATPLRPRDDDVASAQGAALDKDGRYRPAATVELRLDDSALGRPARVDSEVEDLGLQLQAFQQGIEAGALERRNLELKGLAAERLDHDLVLQEFGTDPLRVGVGLVDLVDRHDQRDVCCLRVGDRLDGLRHD